jgi:hypothetical protein
MTYLSAKFEEKTRVETSIVDPSQKEGKNDEEVRRRTKAIQ